MLTDLPDHARPALEAKLLGNLARDPASGCWLWTRGTNDWGYGKVYHKGRDFYAHRVAYALFCGPIPEGHQVLHGCDNPRCANPAHLSTGDNQANVDDRDAKRRNWRKLTDRVVDEIRALRALGHPPMEIARRVKKPPSTVRDVVNGRQWRKYRAVSA